ncbi:MAG: PDZ domain-containing protein [Sphingomonadales bacterium]|nr:PDZ domain-containing protein [Sphingomonadales bacterium]
MRNAIAFTPRNAGGRVTGIAVAPAGDSGLFEAAGLRSGDVITSVNGRRITSTADASALARQLRSGARISLEVERGATTVPIAINLE